MSSADAGRRANGLLAVLRERIRRQGPLRLDAYMQSCLADPEHGYWRKACSLGADGDFITAPEISQVFGEIVGLWAVTTWQRLGEPAPLRLIELGPGRGTLLRDGLRAAGLVQPFLAGGFKAYLSERAFIRGELRSSWSSDHLAALAWRAGAGIDF